jgi:hypothetical protein
MKKLLLLFALFSFQTTAQKPIVFKEVWVWEYTDEDGQKQEMAIYHLPSKNYWLFTPEAYGSSGEMISYILAKPNGEYTFAFQNEHSEKLSLQNFKVNFPSPLPLPPEGKKTKNFGDTFLGFPLIKGKQFQRSDGGSIYLAATKSSLLPILHFNLLEGDAKIPIHFPGTLPGNMIPLEEMKNGQVKYSFKFISNTEYWIYQY